MHLAHWWWVSIFFCVFDSDFKIFFVFLILPSLWWVRGVGWWWVFWYFGHCHCSGFIVCFLWWRHCDVVSAVFRGGYGGRKGLQEEEEYGFVLVFTQHRFYFKKKKQSYTCNPTQPMSTCGSTCHMPTCPVNDHISS